MKRRLLFYHPLQQRYKQVKNPFLNRLFFGPLNFLFEGAFSVFALTAFFTLITVGLAWLLWPSFAATMLSRYLTQKGWVQLSDKQIEAVEERITAIYDQYKNPDYWPL
jgi:hypothetical protein